MKEMRVRDFEELSYPRRRPWLLLIILLIVAIFVWQKYYKKNAPEEQADMPVAEAVIIGETLVDVRVAEAVAMDEGQAEPESRAAVNIEQALQIGKQLYAQGDLSGCRNQLIAIVGAAPGSRAEAEAMQILGKVNPELVMTPRMMPEKTDYVVQRGDSVERIARRFGTTVELIQISNDIANPNRIMIGDNLRVLSGEFEIIAGKKANNLTVYLNGKFFKRYSVGTGKYGKTPTGTFVIAERIQEPVWWRPDGKEVPFGDPENILGTRWMTLRATGDTPKVRGYGIHGTWDESSIGKAESAGCIRMRNAEVEELFTLIPVGTKVTIVD